MAAGAWLTPSGHDKEVGMHLKVLRALGLVLLGTLLGGGAWAASSVD